MKNIQVLDNQTIDQIAAGEVVERPASIVKELVENAMDSGADAVTVEIRGGGIELIRVTDNGCGIGTEDISTAFLRHATSKIRDIHDLETLHSMGFRGEALASIASVCKVRMITKCADELMGHQYSVNGGVAGTLEEVGAPNGTTVIAAHLFYNTPVRRKFLKSATAEGNVITELMEHLALSRPDISYKFILNGNTRFMTTGNGDLKEVIYRIYGRDTAKAMVPVSYDVEGIRIDGYLGDPTLNRPNRNFENYFLNRRYIRSTIVAGGIEEGYKGYLMQHKFPFCVLHITMDSAEIDVNVHPSKMDVRFHDRQQFFDHMSQAVADTLHRQEMIPESILEKPVEHKEKIHAPEPFETMRRQEERENAGNGHAAVENIAAEEDTAAEDGTAVSGKLTAADDGTKAAGKFTPADDGTEASGKLKAADDGTEISGKIMTVENIPKDEDLPVNRENRDIFEVDFDDATDQPKVLDYRAGKTYTLTETAKPPAGMEHAGAAADVPAVSESADLLTEKEAQKNAPAAFIPEDPYRNAKQMEMLPKERVISANARKQYRLIGQIFNTYWMFAYQEKLYFVDQHAAHEKVNYERLVRQYEAHEVYSQQLNPPIIVSLSPTETETLEDFLPYFAQLGFTIEPFGGTEYSISAIPLDLYRKDPKALFMEILNELSIKGLRSTPQIIDRVLATMACKASVKGGDVISHQEMDAVLDELLTLKNPYHCPHGRPTIFSMSRTELERKFKRIVG